MQAGEVRGPVKSDFGWHVIKVNQVRAGNQQPFESVRAQLEAELAGSGRDRAFNDLSGKLVDAVYKNPTSLAPAAKALGLSVQTTPAFARSGGQGIAANPNVLRAAFSASLIQDGTASDPIELGPNKMVMIRVIEHEPEAVLPLASVSDAVIVAIRADRQRKAAQAAADALLKAAKAKGLTVAANDAKLATASLDGVQRGASFPSRPLVDAFFDVPRPAANLAEFGTTSIGGRYVVFEIRSVHDGELSQVTPEQRTQLREQMSRAVGLEAQKAYVAGERARYRIQVIEDRL
jgi:peptidyl-prolyl cis-trans isomerase D